MMANLDVFVFTLGLTEGWRFRKLGRRRFRDLFPGIWRSPKDDAVLPTAPGVAGGEWLPSDYEFVNERVPEITENLVLFIDKLCEINPGARIILTVSPVPLVATYEDRHVLVSTVYSKSVLRVAAQEVSQSRPQVAYFPSFEIVTATANAQRYFEDDLRSVNELGVEHVMRTFFFVTSRPTAATTLPPLHCREPEKNSSG